MTGTKRSFVDGRYGQMHLRMAGPFDAPKRPLVCLHMFPQSGRNFEAFVAAASDERLVIAPDFPGYGESSPPAAPITATDYAAAIWDVVDALKLLGSHQSIDVFGIHAGAKVTVEFVRQRPDDVNRIVLASAAVLHPDEIDHLKRIFTPVALDEQGSRFTHLWDVITRNRGPQMSLEMCAVGLAEMLRGGEGYEWGHHAIFDYNRVFADALKDIHHPVALFNVGDELHEMTPRSMQYLPNATLVDLKDWSHGFLEVHAVEVAKLVNDWMDERYQAPAATEAH